MSVVKKIFKRYFIDAMGAMALGLFASLIVGLIISQLAKIPGLGILSQLTGQTGAASPVIGCAIGCAIAWGLGVKPLVCFTSTVTGAIGYVAGGPVGAYIGAVVGAELGERALEGASDRGADCVHDHCFRHAKSFSLGLCS